MVQTTQHLLISLVLVIMAGATTLAQPCDTRTQRQRAVLLCSHDDMHGFGRDVIIIEGHGAGLEQECLGWVDLCVFGYLIFAIGIFQVI